MKSLSQSKTLPGFRMRFGSSARLDGAHRRDLRGRTRDLEKVFALEPDAVLGGDRAADRTQRLVHTCASHPRRCCSMSGALTAMCRLPSAMCPKHIRPRLRERARTARAAISWMYAGMSTMGRLTSKSTHGPVRRVCQGSSRIAHIARRSASDFAMTASSIRPCSQRLFERLLESLASASGSAPSDSSST